METDKNDDDDKKKKRKFHFVANLLVRKRTDLFCVLQLQSAASSRAMRRSCCFWSR